MSGFDENPFGEPNINDPFSNPPVRQVPPAGTTKPTVDDENPFAEQVLLGAGPVRGAANPPLYSGTGASQQPATLQSTSQEAPPPSYARSSQQTIPQSMSSTFSPTSDQRSTDGWKSRTEEDMRNTPHYSRRNNWPPLPDKCCFQPCFYQDIDVEIQTDFQTIVRQLYRLWMFHGLVLVLNVLGGLALLFTYGEFSIFGLGLLYLVLFTPFSFLCWFRPAYKAFKNDSSINFMVFFFVFFFQFIVTSIQAFGIPGSGTCGIIKARSMFDGKAKGTFVGILMLIVTLGYILAAAADFLMLTKVHRVYRHSEASVSKAQQEFATTFLRNEHVQNAASNVAANAVRAQMAQAAGQTPRY